MAGFTPLYDWVMENPELEHTEALIVCRVLRWRDRGCVESNTRIAKALKLDPRTIQRNIKSLVKKEWLAVLYPRQWQRIIYVDPKRLDVGPLFRGIGIKVVQKLTTHGMASRVKSKRPTTSCQGGATLCRKNPRHDATLLYRERFKKEGK